MCELCSEDIFSLNGQDVNYYIEKDELCVFTSMSANGHPKCAQNGVQKIIQDDNDPGLCEINLKRIDSVALNRLRKVDVDEQFEWRLVEVNKCSAAFHGGKNPCHQGLVVLEWYKIFKQPYQTWENSQKICEDINSSLIYRLNATNEHLKLIKQSFVC